MNKITIPLGNGYNLVAGVNPDNMFDKELYVSVEKDNGEFVQDLALVRPTYKIGEDNKVEWFGDKHFEVFAYGDADIEDYTYKAYVSLYEENEENS